MVFNGKPPKMSDLEAVYDFLMDKITRQELAERIGHSRTTLYYYVARAMTYWLRTGRLKFDNEVKDAEGLGGRQE